MINEIIAPLPEGGTAVISCKGDMLTTAPLIPNAHSNSKVLLFHSSSEFDACINKTGDIFLYALTQQGELKSFSRTKKGWTKASAPSIPAIKKFSSFCSPNPYLLYCCEEDGMYTLYLSDLSQENSKQKIAHLRNFDAFCYTKSGSYLYVICSEQDKLSLNVFCLPGLVPIMSASLFEAYADGKLCCALQDTYLYTLFCAGTRLMLSVADVANPSDKRVFDLSGVCSYTICNDGLTPYAMLIDDKECLRLNFKNGKVTKHTAEPANAFQKYLFPLFYFIYPKGEKNSPPSTGELLEEIFRLQNKILNI